MKLDYLKIDRALLREISTSMIDDALVRSILETGNFLGIKTVAGFIEDADTLRWGDGGGLRRVSDWEPKPLDRRPDGCAHCEAAKQSS
jgi:EAL domain-containing protein (putative c-di-GMP-specific phosphodiesterase class I)